MSPARPRIAKPLYDFKPWFYGLLGLSALALSYLRLEGAVSGIVALVGLAACIWALVIALRRRDFRAMRDEYGGDSLPPTERNQD